MKRIVLPLVILLSFLSIAQSQIISFEKIKTFTTGELDTMLMNAGGPPGIIVPEYNVDYYKVLYLTPYRHTDSLVQASGAICIPAGYADTCGLPIAAYGHGTQCDINSSASAMNGMQWELSVFFASTGYIITTPDYLGLGDSDPNIVIHPYQHAFSQSHTTMNIVRATRQVADSLNVDLSGQLFLYGYSQGGFTVAATLRLMEEQYPNEFQVTASAPMSGALDMAGAQVDLMASDSVYPTPGYLPFVILAYQDQYGNLFDSVQQILKSPYDTLIPPLFYGKTTGMGTINGLVTPVPKHMIVDTLLTAFLADSTHRFRLLLNQNDMLNWTPQSPVKLYYCEGDDQVSYVNSENAYDSWTARGAQFIEKQDFGAFDHNGCALYCFISGKGYFDSFKAKACSVTGIEPIDVSGVKLYPNPTTGDILMDVPAALLGGYATITVTAISGNEVMRVKKEITETNRIDMSGLPTGVYLISVPEWNFTKRVVVSKN